MDQERERLKHTWPNTAEKITLLIAAIVIIGSITVYFMPPPELAEEREQAVEQAIEDDHACQDYWHWRKRSAESGANIAAVTDPRMLSCPQAIHEISGAVKHR